MAARVEDMELKFDPIVVNVDLAKKYLKDHRNDFTNWVLFDVNTQLETVAETKRCKILMEKIKENSELICQLEYLENNVPVEVTKINIQLILKYLSLNDTKYKYEWRFRLAKKSVKVIPLAFIWLYNVYNPPERVAVCHLFVKLKLESGFIIDGYYDLGVVLNQKQNIGIISERSDLDSAVDAFLTSSSNITCFWRLCRIYVQESIYESFKELLDIKTTLRGANETENVELKHFCSDLFVYEDKYILIDYVGDVNSIQLDGIHAIFVEAYRTNKELVSLVGQAGCVSLWSSDVAEANELAYGIPAALVWINDYANFDGPPEISTILLSLTGYPYHCSIPSSFYSRYKIWSTYSKDKRLSIIREVLEKDVALKPDCKVEKIKEVSGMLEKIDKIKFSSVDVADNKMCVTLDYPVGVYYEFRSDVEAIIHSLVVGNGVIGRCDNDLSKFPFYNELTRAGVPISCEFPLNNNEEFVNTCISSDGCRTKVVLTNFGTIFAN